MKHHKYFLLAFLLIQICIIQATFAQQLRLPEGGVNFKSSAHRTVGVTDISINWNAPGVKGREGKIWGTDVAPWGFTVLGFGSKVNSPWRAGANENTTISFSTDVTIQGKVLRAGTYGFFIALYPDSCTLIFNKNTIGWGSYFYDSTLDVLRVGTKQQKDLALSKERLEFAFSQQTKNSVEIALEWERWRIPFTVTVDDVKTALASIRLQMTGALGFDPASLEAAANWCLQQKVNQEQALDWITRATDPNLGGVQNFNVLSIKSGLLNLLGKTKEADETMKMAIEKANTVELHNYGRQLLGQQKVKEAMEVFKKNHEQSKGAWPTNAGLMRGYAALGDYKNALIYAKLALEQTTDVANKKFIEQAIEKLAAGKPL
jgi:tetratricopeptide (TPR) repeat protein